MIKPRILFLGTDNSTASQMAEALMRKYAGTDYDVYSAGIQSQPIDPLTVQVMEEIGCDMSSACSKKYSDIAGKLSFSLIVMVCEDLQKMYTISPGASMLIIWNFCDPKLYFPQGEQRLGMFRDLRDQVDHKVAQIIIDMQSQTPH